MKTVGGARFASLSETKTRLPKLLEKLPTVLLRRSQPVAALVSIETYNDYLAPGKLVRHPALFDRLRSLASEARVTPIAALRTMGDLEELHAAQREARRAEPAAAEPR